MEDAESSAIDYNPTKNLDDDLASKDDVWETTGYRAADYNLENTTADADKGSPA